MKMRRRAFQVALGAALLPDLAAAAQADQWFIFLETGRPTPDDKEAVAAMQRGHIENFKRLFALGRLFAAGPLADPARTKRGIVTVQAASREELAGHFQPDAYVREGYMTLNAVPATPNRALHTDGIDASRVEEVRIVLVERGPAQPAALQALLDRGTVQAWYTLHEGPLAEVLFARGTDTAALEAAFKDYPAPVRVWRQWLSPGVVR